MQHVDEGQLHAYLDGEPGEDPRELESHLEGCVECRARMEGVRLLRERGRGLLSDTRPVHHPPFDAVVARSQRPAARSGWVPRRIAPLAWAASLVVALGAGWLARDLLRQDDGPRTEVAVSTESRAGDGAALGARSTQPPASVPQAAGGTARSAHAPAEPPRVAARAAAEQPAPAPGDGARAGAANDAAVTEALEAVTVTAAPPTAAVAAPATVPRTAPVAERRARSSGSAVTLEGAPAGAPLDAVVAAADGAGWMVVDPAHAADQLGAAVPIVPDLRVLSIELSRSAATPTVRIRQALSGGGVLTLTAQRAPEPGAAAVRARVTGAAAQSADAAGTAGLTRQVGPLLVTAQAPLPADSLQRVLARVR